MAIGQGGLPHLLEDGGITRIGTAEDPAVEDRPGVEHRQQDPQGQGETEPPQKAVGDPVPERGGSRPGRGAGGGGLPVPLFGQGDLRPPVAAAFRAY